MESAQQPDQESLSRRVLAKAGMAAHQLQLAV